jgi:hypothetical protein
MLQRLIAAHAGGRHTRLLPRRQLRRDVAAPPQPPQADAFTPDQMRDWYVPHHVLDAAGEHIIAQASTFNETVEAILATSELLSAPIPVPAGTPA